jgi:hypothetical protein
MPQNLPVSRGFSAAANMLETILAEGVGLDSNLLRMLQATTLREKFEPSMRLPV